MSCYFTITELNDIGNALSRANKKMLLMIGFIYIGIFVYYKYSNMWSGDDTHSYHTDAYYYN
jgi:hypothetical protein